MNKKVCPDYFEDEVCPDCGQKGTIRAKELWEGGGIECTTPGCHYWFCY